ACAEENDCGQYFKEQKLSKKDIEEIKDITMGMAKICRGMHESLLQNVDNQVMKGIEKIYEITNEINEGDHVYTLAKTENRQKQLLDQSKPYNPNPKIITYETQPQVHHDLQYYIDHEDMGLEELYQVYEEAHIKALELYKPETYRQQIEHLEGSGSLYIGEVGTYNRKLDEDDFRNYLDEIVIGWDIPE
ncbi:MAG: hypothetical protein ACK5KQ_00005, partial [Anaerorhabdus sp.]